MSNGRNKYCIDSSILIDLGQSYPEGLVPEIWKILEKLIEEQRLKAPKEVLLELKKSDDELSEWAQSHEEIFVEVDAEQIQIIKKLLIRYPVLAGAEREPPHADPWVIALAIKENEAFKKGDDKLPCVVVTSERFKPNSFKIPNICKDYGIECLRLFDFWEKEKTEC